MHCFLMWLVVTSHIVGHVCTDTVVSAAWNEHNMKVRLQACNVKFLRCIG